MLYRARGMGKSNFFCKQSNRVNPNYTYAFYNRAIAKEMLRDLDGACSDWKKAHELGLDAASTYFNSTCK